MTAPAKIVAFESLRGLLAILVMASHVYHVFIRPPNGIVVTDAHQATIVLARFAVVFFFVLSGYVIAMSIDANRRQPDGFSMTRYASARTWRIAPPMLATMLVTSILGIVLLYSGLYFVRLDSAQRMVFVTSSADQLLALLSLTLAGDLTGMGLNGPLWSLALEIQLYVVAGLAAAVTFGRGWAVRLTAAVALLGYLYGIGADHLAGPKGLQRAAMFTAFAAGVFGYVGRSTPRRVALSLAALVATVAAAALALHLDDALGQGPLPEFATQAMAALAFALLLVGMQDARTPPSLSRLGDMAYTLYILHLPLLLFAYFVLFNLAHAAVEATWAPWTGALCGALTFAVCAQVAARVERPARLRRWIDERLTGLAFRSAC